VAIRELWWCGGNGRRGNWHVQEHQRRIPHPDHNHRRRGRRWRDNYRWHRRCRFRRWRSWRDWRRESGGGGGGGSFVETGTTKLLVASGGGGGAGSGLAGSAAGGNGALSPTLPGNNEESEESGLRPVAPPWQLAVRPGPEAPMVWREPPLGKCRRRRRRRRRCWRREWWRWRWRWLQWRRRRRLRQHEFHQRRRGGQGPTTPQLPEASPCLLWEQRVLLRQPVVLESQEVPEARVSPARPHSSAREFRGRRSPDRRSFCCFGGPKTLKRALGDGPGAKRAIGLAIICAPAPLLAGQVVGSMESLLTLGMKMRRSPTFIFVRTPLGSASWF